jgi:hypothetical protein
LRDLACPRRARGCFDHGAIVSIYDMPWFTLTIFHIAVELVYLAWPLAINVKTDLKCWM